MDHLNVIITVIQFRIISESIRKQFLNLGRFMKSVKLNFIYGYYLVVKRIKTTKRKSRQGHLNGKFSIIFGCNISILKCHNLIFNSLPVVVSRKNLIRTQTYKLKSNNNNCNFKNHFNMQFKPMLRFFPPYKLYKFN